MIQFYFQILSWCLTNENHTLGDSDKPADQTSAWQPGCDKNIGSDGFVIRPDPVPAEYVDSNWQTGFARLEVTDRKGHILMNFQVIFQVVNNICPKNSHIGLSAAVSFVPRSRRD